MKIEIRFVCFPSQIEFLQIENESPAATKPYVYIYIIIEKAKSEDMITRNGRKTRTNADLVRNNYLQGVDEALAALHGDLLEGHRGTGIGTIT